MIIGVRTSAVAIQKQQVFTHCLGKSVRCIAKWRYRSEVQTVVFHEPEIERKERRFQHCGRANWRSNNGAIYCPNEPGGYHKNAWKDSSMNITAYRLLQQTDDDSSYTKDCALVEYTRICATILILDIKWLVLFSDELRFSPYRKDGRWRLRLETEENKHSSTICGPVQAGGVFCVYCGWIHHSTWQYRSI